MNGDTQIPEILLIPGGAARISVFEVPGIWVYHFGERFRLVLSKINSGPKTKKNCTTERVVKLRSLG